MQKIIRQRGTGPRATSCRNTGRHHLGTPGRLRRNPHMTYSDGASALDGFNTSPPDVAVLDIKMPRMDGMLNAIGLRLYNAQVGQAMIAGRDVIRELVQEVASAVGGHKFGRHFLLTEWEQVVDDWQLKSWESYRDVVR